MSYSGVSSVKWSTPETLHIGQGKSFLGSLTFLGSPDYWVNISQPMQAVPEYLILHYSQHHKP